MKSVHHINKSAESVLDVIQLLLFVTEPFLTVFETPWTVACQAPLSMGFPGQEYWNGLPFLSPGDFPNPEIQLPSPILTGRFFTTLTPVVAIQSLSHVWLFATSWTAACQAFLPITISQSLFKHVSIESVMASNHCVPRHPLFLLPSYFPKSGTFPMSWLFASGGQSIGV